jgi:hypothetical protein
MEVNNCEGQEEISGMVFIDMEGLETECVGEELLLDDLTDDCRRMAVGLGPGQFDALLSCVDDAVVATGKYLLPLELTKYIGIFNQYNRQGFIYMMNWHALVLPRFDMVVVDGMNIVQVDVVAPYGVSTQHLSKELSDDLGVNVAGSIVAVTGKGRHVIDYIVPKWDGKLVVVYSLGDYHLITVAGMNPRLLSGYCPPMIGELVSETIYARVGTVARQLDYISKTWKVVATDKYDTIDDVHKKKFVDGLIVCVDGTEYKIKYVNTVELRFDGMKFYDANGGRYDYSDSRTFTNGRIYECEVRKGRTVVVIKEREDKTYPQSQGQISVINSSITVSAFLTLMRGVRDVRYSALNYIVPPRMAMTYLYNRLGATDDVYMSEKVIEALLLQCGIRTTQDIWNFMNVRVGATINREQLLRSASPLIFATPTDVMNIIYETKLNLSPREMCYQIIRRGLIVAPSMIHYLVTHGYLQSNYMGVSCVRLSTMYPEFNRVERVIPLDWAKKTLEDSLVEGSSASVAISAMNYIGAKNGSTVDTINANYTSNIRGIDPSDLLKYECARRSNLTPRQQDSKWFVVLYENYWKCFKLDGNRENFYAAVLRWLGTKHVTIYAGDDVDTVYDALVLKRINCCRAKVNQNYVVNVQRLANSAHGVLYDEHLSSGPVKQSSTIT